MPLLPRNGWLLMNVPSSKRRRMLWLLSIVLILLIAVVVAGTFIVRRHAEPILRARIIESLSTRFNSRVELGEFHGDLRNGLLVEGSDLKLYPRNSAGDKPLFAVRRFSFRTSWSKLLRTPMHIELVRVEGMEINLPTKDQGAKDQAAKDHRTMSGTSASRDKISIYVSEIDAADSHLTMGTSVPGKVPLDFKIRHLVLNTVGPNQPLRFQATLVNPKPVGDIASSGDFGPFDAGNPGNSNVRGSYEFSHADLSTIKGIGGILSSQGQYSGTLNRITVDGHTDTPDFRISISGHPVPLHTTFHAIVDGTNGDTFLDPVDATLLHSHIRAHGRVVREKDRRVEDRSGLDRISEDRNAEHRRGHHITLDVIVDKARIEDLLRLGVHTDPPVMTGAVQLKTRLDLPPSKLPVNQRLRLHGQFSIEGAHFTNPATQQKINSLSLRGQGKLKEIAGEIPDNVLSRMRGNFTLENSRVTLEALQYTVPGLQVNMDGVYSLDGKEFDFHGKARLDAKLSQMTAGWKSLLLKPVDPFFSRHGAGTELPIKITGTRSEPRFGLDFGH